MRKLLAFVGAAVLLSACVADIGPEDRDLGEQVESQGEALDDKPGSIDGTPCCAIDYREGGEVEVCGKRKGMWCCNEENTVCAACDWYECEPPPEKPTKTFPKPVIVIPPNGGVYAP